MCRGSHPRRVQVCTFVLDERFFMTKFKMGVDDMGLLMEGANSPPLTRFSNPYFPKIGVANFVRQSYR